MSKVDLPDAVTVPDYAAELAECKASYASKMGISADALNDNDPAVKILEILAYRRILTLSATNDSVRNTLLTHAKGKGLDNIGADPLYDTERLLLDPGDPGAVPPVLPTYEADDVYRERLRLAPHQGSVAGPLGAYESIARGAHVDVVDVVATSPDPADMLIEVLHASSDPAILTVIAAALNAELVRPAGDRVTVQAALRVASTVNLKIFVSEGPAIDVIKSASQARVDQTVLPLAAKVRSGARFSEGDPYAWLGACVVPGVSSWEVTSTTGLVDTTRAWWPMTITVTAERTSA